MPSRKSANVTMPVIMARRSVFIDSSAIFSGVFSSQGASRALLLLAEAGLIQILVSEQVIEETENALARKAPSTLPYYRQAIRKTGLRILPDPETGLVRSHQGRIKHQADLPILVAAITGGAEYLASLDRHFLEIAESTTSDLPRIGTPGQVLGWLTEDGFQAAG